MDLGMCHVAQATRGNTDVLVRVVGEKGAVDEVKHVVEIINIEYHISIVFCFCYAGTKKSY